MTLEQLIQQGSRKLAAISNTPRLDSELLLGAILDKPRSWLLAWPEKPLDPAVLRQVQILFERRVQGEPVAYILQRQPFWTFTLEVSGDVLIPRAETESLIEHTLNESSLVQHSCRVLELGTGSGAIAMALAAEQPAWEIHASDCSVAALRIAQRNAACYQLDHIHFIAMDWFAAITPQPVFDIIIANPPYIDRHDPELEYSVSTYEPEWALIAANNGRAALDHIIQQAPRYLSPGGMLCLEHGWLQGPAIIKAMQNNYFIDCRAIYDLNSHWRGTAGWYR